MSTYSWDCSLELPAGNDSNDGLNHKSDQILYCNYIVTSLHFKQLDSIRGGYMIGFGWKMSDLDI